MLSRLEAILRGAIGLDLQSLGRGTLERAVDQRAAMLGLDRLSYVRRVEGSPEELQELTEALVVPETWFFRQREAFAATAMLAARHRASTSQAFRVLSVPCSTGEEPYSIAIALLEQQVPADRFVVDAVDISRRSLAVAAAGVFGANSFRSDYVALSQYFQPARRGLAVVEVVRQQVRFRHANLLSDGFLANEAPYDAIFCRNLLIYFDGESQKRAFRTLERLLAPDGMLFVGPADGFGALMYGYEPVRLLGATAYRKPGAARASAEPRSERPSQKRSARPRPRIVKPSTAPRIAPIVAERSVEPPPALTLTAARSFADAGQLDDAVAACRQYMLAQGPSAEAFYLLGVIADASNDTAGAEAFYRKALYLDPAHAEALSHLALLAAQAGDAARARVLAARGRRAGDAAGRTTGGAR
jgi:chemotaxis protein methyltransferase WspC